MSHTVQNIAGIFKTMGLAAQKAGKNPDDVKLVAVSKTVSAEKILEAYHAGLRDFGENRVQELIEKKKQLPADIRWHLIGHLQSNKVKSVLGEAILIHSLDRLDLAAALEKEAVKKGLDEVKCLVQLNLTGEESKFGLTEEAFGGFVRDVSKMKCVKLCGLMVMGPLTEDRTRIRKVFAQAREIFEKAKRDFPEHAWKILSMGMSGDYEIAVEEGATLVRIGTALFGERPF